MNYRWNFAFHKVLILYLCGVVLGFEIALLVTRNVSLLAGVTEIIAMLLLSLVVIVSSRSKESR